MCGGGTTGGMRGDGGAQGVQQEEEEEQEHDEELVAVGQQVEELEEAVRSLCEVRAGACRTRRNLPQLFACNSRCCGNAA